MRIPSSGRISRCLIVGAVALVMGCSDSLSPLEVAGTYVLRTIDGNPLPATLAISGTHTDYSIMVVADTLVLTPDRSGMLITIQDIVHDESGGEVERVRADSHLSFRTTGDQLEITFLCPPNALMNCAPGPHMTARLASGRLSVSRPYGKLMSLLTYAPVD